MTKIVMKSWLTFHERNKMISTDGWYLDFANKLFPIISANGNFANDAETQKHFAIMLTTYLEDCIRNDGSGWGHFTEMYHQRYGAYLPFYETSDDYMPDEINIEDVCFLLWSFYTRIEQFGQVQVINPFDEQLLKLSQDMYDFMDSCFEQAPITTIASRDWVIEPEFMEIDQSPLPDIKVGDKLKPDVERFLQGSNGNFLMYFLDYSELKSFFIHTLGWSDEEDALLPDLRELKYFVLYANAKGLIIAPNVGWCFKDSRNPNYNEMMAVKEGYSLFCNKGCCPFDLLKYAMAHSLIPDAAFPFESGKKLLHDNWDFVTRWFLRDYFEGD